MEQGVPQKKKSGGLGMIIIAIIIIAVGYFLLNRQQPVSVDPIPEEGVNQVELEELDNMEDQSELSTEDDIATIEAELDATSFDELEADLNSFDF